MNVTWLKISYFYMIHSKFKNSLCQINWEQNSFKIIIWVNKDLDIVQLIINNMLAIIEMIQI